MSRMKQDAVRPLERVVRVEAVSRGYDVVVGDAVRSSVAGRVGTAAAGARRALLVTDAGIAEGSVVLAVHAELAKAGLEVVQGPRLTPTEAMKSLATIEQIVGAMSAARLDRGDVAVVLGGGVLGDLVGFAAAVYRRGIRWVNMPSTLLAMVDASVGGKTGANIAAGGSLKKNMVGAFWQPSLVVADVGLLRTLDERQFRSGLAECIKHGMLAADFGDAGLGAWTNANLSKIVARDAGTLVELVARNVAVKARVVGRDEREEAADGEGGRALLNLGHTFGHVLETLPGLDLHHGEAVGLGLIAASAAGAALGRCGSEMVEQTRAAVAAAGLPTAVQSLVSTADLAGLMMDDKKVKGGVLRIVVPCGVGRCGVVTDPARGAVGRGWEAIRGGGRAG